MRMIMIECTAQELSANKRVADSIVDAISRFADGLSRIKIPSVSTQEEAPEDDSDE